MVAAAYYDVAAEAGQFYLALHNHKPQLQDGLHLTGELQRMELASACYLDKSQVMHLWVDVGKVGKLVVFGVLFEHVKIAPGVAVVLLEETAEATAADMGEMGELGSDLHEGEVGLPA